MKYFWLLLVVMVFSACDKLGLGDVVHIGVRTKTVLDSMSVEPDIDYLGQQRQLSAACIGSFRTIDTGRGEMQYPISSDNFVSLRFIQRSLIKNLLGEAYAEDYIDHAVRSYCQEHPDDDGDLSLRTVYNRQNIYACMNGTRCFVYNVSSGVRLKLSMLFEGDYESMFLTVLGHDDVDLHQFCITERGVECWWQDVEGDPERLVVPVEVARDYLQDNWKHLWR